MSCVSRKVPEPAANKEDIEGKSHMRSETPLTQMFHGFVQTSVEEDVMMEAVQVSSSSQPTEELTELGVCLMRDEVRLVGGHACSAGFH